LGTLLVFATAQNIQSIFAHVFLLVSSELWRNASPSEKAPFIEGELKERAEYKEKIQEFREKQATIDAATRVTHQSAVSGHFQHYEQRSMSKSMAGFDRPTRGSPSNLNFEGFTLDPLNDEPTSKPSAFRLHPSQQYHRPSYHHSDYYFAENYPQATWSALSMDEADPLPVAPTRGQPHYQPAPQMSSTEDFHTNSAFYPTRGNSQFSDPFDMSRFPRYP
jgi:hypothetical protein